MSAKRVLVFDVETAPMLAYVWDLHDQDIGLTQLHTDWYIIAWGAKWLGEPASKVIYRDQRDAKNMEDDRKILLELWELLNEADIVITQNGKNFDSPKLNARFIEHGIKPPRPYKHLDTYQIVKSAAKFSSNKLEYLTNKLCTRYKKLSHKRFPGFTLWKECLKGNKRAWDEMKRYNVHDVLSTEEFYMKIRAWAPMSAPAVHDRNCEVCGGSDLQKRGIEVLRTARYVRLQCQTCGKWMRGAKVKGEK